MNDSREATFFVRDVPVYGDKILSPMAGYSDVPYRAICRAYGSAMNYTEFVAVEMLQGKRNKMWHLLDYKPGEYPVVFQIFGNDARKILNAAQRIEELEPDIIDINMGCSTRRVSGRGAGVGMMRDPELVAETFRLLTTHLSVPVTAKIRLGWDDLVNYLKIARILEDNGAALIAMHARTKEEKYRGKADWEAIARLKQAVSVPVIGNGDVKTPADVERMKAETGCDAVMIGRGAVGNPWIFAGKRRSDLLFPELTATIRLHLAEMLDYHGEYGLILLRKHLKRYFKGMPLLKPFVDEMMQVETAGDLEEALSRAEAQVAQESDGRVASLLKKPIPAHGGAVQK